jgi:hypothetical protein
MFVAVMVQVPRHVSDLIAPPTSLSDDAQRSDAARNFVKAAEWHLSQPTELLHVRSRLNESAITRLIHSKHPECRALQRLRLR